MKRTVLGVVAILIALSFIACDFVDSAAIARAGVTPDGDIAINDARFHCNANGGNGRVWVLGGISYQSKSIDLVLTRIGDTQFKALKAKNGIDLTCVCGSSEWVTFSNNSGNLNGKNVQMQHPVAEPIEDCPYIHNPDNDCVWCKGCLASCDCCNADGTCAKKHECNYNCIKCSCGKGEIGNGYGNNVGVHPQDARGDWGTANSYDPFFVITLADIAAGKFVDLIDTNSSPNGNNNWKVKYLGKARFTYANGYLTVWVGAWGYNKDSKILFAAYSSVKGENPESMFGGNQLPVFKGADNATIQITPNANGEFELYLQVKGFTYLTWAGIWG